MSGFNGAAFSSNTGDNSPRTARMGTSPDQISPATYSNFGGNMGTSSGSFGAASSNALTNSRGVPNSPSMPIGGVGAVGGFNTQGGYNIQGGVGGISQQVSSSYNVRSTTGNNAFTTTPGR